jgi:hypothetical protein
MRNKISSIGAVVLVSVLTAWAADIPGRWIAKTPGQQGIVETVFDFKVNGTKLTGTVSGPLGEAAISEGEIKGDNISFVVVVNSSGKEVKQEYSGKVSLNEISFTREVLGQREEFIAKREFQRHNDYLPLPRVAPVPPPR